MLVFREGRRSIDAGSRARALVDAMRDGDALDALLRASELETALDDAGDLAARAIEAWTDVAALALASDTRPHVPGALPALPTSALRASAPEGFAYYALHPLDYANAARTAVPAGAPSLVIGIRTIGTTLSAIASASLRARGDESARITVRPTGHPFDRRVVLDERARDAVRAIASRPGAWTLVADEGPGLSGSSFLAAADAAREAGVDPERLVLLPSHPPDVSRLCAPDAARRWSALRVVVASPSRASPARASIDLSAGAWRAHAYAAQDAWPAAWPAMERRKYLTGNRRELLKFEGLAMYGAAARARASQLAARGVGPRARPADDGFVAWERVPGAPMRAGTRPPPIDALARAIASRLELPIESPIDLGAIETMARTNVRELLDRELELSLPLARPAIVDGRMQPHEWIDTGDRIVKTDAISHGDDHWLPGPCDIAWDLAGAITEWRLDGAHAAALVERYARASGDRDAAARVPAWTIAYLAFRAGWLAMARDACAGGPEHARLERAAEQMRHQLDRTLLHQ